ncbi:MAG: YggT family protein [Anaerolineae bacterium]|jgi:YggT family protein|nr:YggT family protein [Anaerolineae bacterium]MBT7075103.1 YggT family protein [Anaerolineae bacterium]MBT7782558.1 YggT family protein [Anaerolineae bacterium]
MVILLLIKFIEITAQALIILVIISIVLSYFMSPYHQVRQSIDKVVQPMLMPIRSVVPLIGMFDLSPMILIILIQILSSALISFLYILR